MKPKSIKSNQIANRNEWKSIKINQNQPTSNQSKSIASNHDHSKSKPIKDGEILVTQIDTTNLHELALGKSNKNSYRLIILDENLKPKINLLKVLSILIMGVISFVLRI